MPTHAKVSMNRITYDVVAFAYPTWKVSLSLLGLSLMSSMGVLLIITSVISRLGTKTGLQKLKGEVVFVLFLPRSQHNVHRICTVLMHCKAADSCCNVHEAAVSEYGMMRSCISSKVEHSHCESALGACCGGTQCT